MKKVLLIILCVLIVIAPTVALLGYYFFADHSEETVKSEVVSAKFLSAGGEYEELGVDNVKVQAFLSLHRNGDKEAESLTALPQDALSNTLYEVMYTDNFDVQETYKYYLCSDKNKCYFQNGKQQTYKVAPAAAEGFLNSDFSEKVYQTAAAPVVRLGDTVLEPSSLDWNYKTVGGLLKKASCSFENNGASTKVESFDAALNLATEYTPDEVRLVIKNSDTGARLFSGSKQALLKTVFEGSVSVSVQMTLVWKEASGAAYAGSADYRFSGRLLGTPAFSFNVDAAKCGDVVILSAFNVVDTSNIQIDIEPAFDYTPVFYKVGQSHQALIPIPADLVNEKTDFTFTVSSSTATDILHLNVQPVKKGEYKFYSPTAGDFYNEQVLANYHNAIDPILAQSSSFSFAGGRFVLPAADNYVSDTSNYSFGTTVNVLNINKTFTAWDNMYCAQTRKENDVYVEGTVTKVLAAFAGKVVYVGAQTFTGRMVIIDHGSGLKTVYTNLSSDIAVHAGDTVEAGAFISHAADGGFNSSMNFNFHVGAYVHGVPVALQHLIDKGLIAN